MRFSRLLFALLIPAVAALASRAATPVTVTSVTGKAGMVVAAHPQAAEAGLAVLKAGGNAIDAAVATSLAVGVAEPYGSGLGGKLMLLYFEAKTGRTYAIDAMDAAGSLNVAEYVKQPEENRSYGYASVCVPGLAAGLWTAHQRWGARPWSDAVAPAIALARDGFRILPKTRELFAEQEKKLRRGDAEIARLYLPKGQLPAEGSLLPNADLARTMELLAQHGRDGFYKGSIAEAIVRASQQGGGAITLEDLASYQARVLEPVSAEFRGHTIVSGPPPTSGSALMLPILKALEADRFEGPLRSAENLDRVGRVWRAVFPSIGRTVADVPESRALVDQLLASASIAEIRRKAAAPDGGPTPKKLAALEDEWLAANPAASTTHFIVVDRHGNIVSATQSQSLHFGAGVVPPGTGVVMNNSMSNFVFSDARSINYVAPGKRSRSTIAPTIVLREGKPAFAIGIPGSGRIPTALLQVLLDRLAFGRSLADAMGDTRVHFLSPLRREEGEAIEAERSLPHGVAQALQERGWRINLPEEAGTGRYFGGITAVEFNADGTLTGLADPRRTNAAAGF
jgi:gamma-glutamyltranspeptidase/glutathione hydrolase